MIVIKAKYVGTDRGVLETNQDYILSIEGDYVLIERDSVSEMYSLEEFLTNWIVYPEYIQ